MYALQPPYLQFMMMILLYLSLLEGIINNLGLVLEAEIFDVSRSRDFKHSIQTR